MTHSKQDITLTTEELSTIKHDLKNLLNVVVGNICLMDVDNDNAESVNTCMNTIKDMIEYIDNIGIKN